MYCSYRGGLRPSYKYGTDYTRPLRVFDNFNSKAKTIAPSNFSKIKNAKLKVARFLPKIREGFFVNSMVRARKGSYETTPEQSTSHLLPQGTSQIELNDNDLKNEL